MRKPEDFWGRVDRTGGPSACWKWGGRLMRDGYAMLRWNGKRFLAHRLALLLSSESPAEGLLALHRCVASRSCCNPSHLYWGTHKQNAADREAQGRTSRGVTSGPTLHPERMARGQLHGRQTKPERTARGERHGNARYTDTTIRTVRLLRKRGYSYENIAKEVGIPSGSVGGIVRGEAWVHVK